MIKRNIQKNILKYTKQYPVLVLTGPRQSGKTTLLKNIFPKYTYLNLEDLELLEFALSDPKAFLSQYNDRVILDEVQRAPELFSYIQLKVDKKRKNGMYILSGSSNFLLMEKINQSLAGRASIFNLLPFSLREVEKKVAKKSLNDLLFSGFYPRIYDLKINRPDEIGKYYLDYIQTYIERDVRLIKNISNLSLFKKFLVLLAARTGQILNISSLAEDCGINFKTAQEWISVLEASYIIFLLPPYYKNYKKRVIKSPKIYFYDIGILCALLNIDNPKQLSYHFLRGNIFETFVVSEFVKRKYNEGKNLNFYFWRDKSQTEVDLLLEEAGKLTAIEIKSAETIKSDFIKSLDKFSKIAKKDLLKKEIIYGGDEIQKRENLKIISWRKF